MKHIIFTLALLVSFVSKGQNDTNTILGIDLDKDFYTLTDGSAMGYIIAGEENFTKNIPGASYDISEEYLINNANKEFLKIDFNEIFLTFPYNGSSAGLNKLKPAFLIARKKYNSKSEYEINNLNDFNKVVYLLMNQFGAPKSTRNEYWGVLFEWKFPNLTLALKTHNTEQAITLICAKTNVALD
jgi:hypothetical protein|tara:strand:- start:247 stop:801 length:555 start_codon:yes stop_codon:yes gene_type:complete